MVVSYLDFSHLYQWRYLNVFVLLTGVILAAKAYFHGHEPHRRNYFHGYILGIGVCALSSLAYAVFLALFWTHIANFFHFPIADGLPFNELPPLAYPAFAMMEGIFSGVAVTFIVMQYFKNSLGKRKQRAQIALNEPLRAQTAE